ncbi:hypothetical protein OG905_02395 [Streptomyces sp. NBC_00322]|uniref:hypothetical protein n=1 Tax=Streptomyces sp. NBC_00322 TaxID=2975712 RepID=UPI002E2D83F3|nr:hypothetical protein [Streptomyces sp. NBC_00322]
MEVQDPQPEAERRSFPPVSDPDCQTMLDIRSGDRTSTVVFQVFNWKGAIWGGDSTLAAYEDGKAQQVFAQLKQALGSSSRPARTQQRVHQLEQFVTPSSQPRVEVVPEV